MKYQLIKSDFVTLNGFSLYLGKKQEEHMIKVQTLSTNVFKFSLLASMFPVVFFDGST